MDGGHGRIHSRLRHDPEDIFERQIPSYVKAQSRCSIVSLLSAILNTQLWRRWSAKVGCSGLTIQKQHRQLFEFIPKWIRSGSLKATNWFCGRSMIHESIISGRLTV